MKLTKRQVEYVAAIADYFGENDQMPSCEALSEMVGSTHNAAAEMMRRLEREGVLARNRIRKYKRGPKWRAAVMTWA